MRKDVRKGIHAFNYKGKDYRLTDREMLTTGNEGLIKFLRASSAVVVYTPEKNLDNSPKVYHNMREPELVAELEKRGIDHAGMDIPAAINALKKHDQENSKPENDQGETPPE